jgi:hypothetical protein
MNEMPNTEEMRVAPLKPRRKRPSDRPFFVGASIVLALIVFAGFSPSFFLRGIVPPNQPLHSITPLIVVHAILSSAWMLLFIVQAYIAKANVVWHRRLGWAISIVAILYIPLSFEVVVQQAVRGFNLAGDPPLQFFAIALGDLVVFAICLGLGIKDRKKSVNHKRFMLGASAGMVAPGAARCGMPSPILAPIFGFGAPFATVAAMAIWDRYSQGKITKPTKIVFCVVLALAVLRMALSRWPAWQALVSVIVEASRGLPYT